MKYISLVLVILALAFANVGFYCIEGKWTSADYLLASFTMILNVSWISFLESQEKNRKPKDPQDPKGNGEVKA